MRYLLPIIALCALSACAGVSQLDKRKVTINSKYNVLVMAVMNTKNGNVKHVISDIALFKKRPPLHEREAIYILAVEEATGCKVTNIEWVDINNMGQNAIFEAQTDCEWTGSYLPK